MYLCYSYKTNLLLMLQKIKFDVYNYYKLNIKINKYGKNFNKSFN